MPDLDEVLHPIAARRHNVITRTDVLDAGGTDDQIATRLARRQWQLLQAGVYLASAEPPSWEAQLHGGILGTGSDDAAASHRSAVILWDLDGVGGVPLQLTVPMDARPVRGGVEAKRTRRPIEPVLRRGIPVTPIGRTLLDAAGCLPPTVAKKAVESAFRRGHITPKGLDATIRDLGGKGVTGSRWLREYLLTRTDGRAPGSAAEVELLAVLDSWGIEPPVRQFAIPLPDGTVAVVDLAWPDLRKLVEVDGLDAHASPAALAADLARQNLLLEAGYQLRRYPGTLIRRDPNGVAASIVRFLLD